MLVPKLVIADVQADSHDPSAPYAAKYALFRVARARGLAHHVVGHKMSVVEIGPEPGGCDWCYRAPITGSVTIQVYTLWGLPLEKWMVTCNVEWAVSSP